MPQRRAENQMLRRFVGAQVSTLSEYEIDVTLCTSASDALDGDVWVIEGIDTSRFLAHPIVLWSHDMEQPIGQASNLRVTPGAITARVTFPQAGISPKADEIRGLVKAGIVTGVSASVVPVEAEPLNPRDPRGGKRIIRSILVEFSIVAVPADATSGVTARSQGDSAVDGDDIDNGGAALACADEPGEAGNTAAATGESDPQRTAPRKPGQRKPARRAAKRKLTLIKQRGLYEVAQLLYLMEELGWLVDIAHWEATIEDDASKVPAMLAAVLHDLGDATLASAAEEIGELINSVDIEPELDADLPDADRAAVLAGVTPAVRSFRAGLVAARQRGGKKLSADTMRCLREVKEMHEEAIGHERIATAIHNRALGMLDDLTDAAGADDDADPEGATAADDEDAVRALEAEALHIRAKARIRAA